MQNAAHDAEKVRYIMSLGCRHHRTVGI